MDRNDESWSEFSAALLEGVTRVLNERALGSVEQSGDDAVKLDISSIDGSTRILSAVTDGTSFEVTLADAWQWRWQDAIDEFPRVQESVYRPLAELALAYSTGCATITRTLLGYKLHVPISRGDFVNFSRGNTRWIVASSSLG